MVAIARAVGNAAPEGKPAVDDGDGERTAAKARQVYRRHAAAETAADNANARHVNLFESWAEAKGWAPLAHPTLDLFKQI